MAAIGKTAIRRMFYVDPGPPETQLQSCWFIYGAIGEKPIYGPFLTRADALAVEEDLVNQCLKAGISPFSQAHPAHPEEEKCLQQALLKIQQLSAALLAKVRSWLTS